MRIKIHKLILSGPGKPDATLKPEGTSHLVFGPTDTGKSYIEECIAFCLGSENRPRNVGYSQGYTRAALQLRNPDGTDFTFFRDLLEGREAVYEGFHVLPPQSTQTPIAEEVEPLLVEWGKAYGKKILTKSGTLGNVTANDLRRLSLFDEIRTLDKVTLEGDDKLLKMRNRSAVALALTGVDDSNATLAVKTDQRNIAKGHVEALEEEIKSLKAEIPTTWTREDCTDGLKKLETEIKCLEDFLRDNAFELEKLKTSHDKLNHELDLTNAELKNLIEAKDRFLLLDKKYENDAHRLISLITASEIAETFEPKPCPLCKTDLTHTTNHKEKNHLLREAANAEVIKINALRKGLTAAIADIVKELNETTITKSTIQRKIEGNLQAQAELIRPELPTLEPNYLNLLSARKTELTIADRNFQRIDTLNKRLASMTARAKRQKQSITRDLSSSSNDLCRRINTLLKTWGVPMVESIHFDEEKSDIHINNRERASFGKGKRGIFLTALIVSIMERALSEGTPHLGFIVIDSPVVTYKDPKHGSKEEDEALDLTVKDKFYDWLADRREPGQIIVLENEEPDSNLQVRLSHTEFVGVGKVEGRRGFFPT